MEDVLFTFGVPLEWIEPVGVVTVAAAAAVSLITGEEVLLTAGVVVVVCSVCSSII